MLIRITDQKKKKILRGTAKQPIWERLRAASRTGMDVGAWQMDTAGVRRTLESPEYTETAMLLSFSGVHALTSSVRNACPEEVRVICGQRLVNSLDRAWLLLPGAASDQACSVAWAIISWVDSR